MDSNQPDQPFYKGNVSMEETIETIAAMRHQISTGYVVTDYFFQNRFTPLDVDRDCRGKMVQWSYQVVDFCKFRRETVEIAMSYLDRFLSTQPGIHALHDRSVYQLAAMAALYTAVKIHEPEAMDPALVSNLSRGTYTPSEVEEMEYIVIQALNWRLNPPTTLSFVREFFRLIPLEALDDNTRTLVYELSKFQAELATSSNEFVAISSAEKAYCCFLNALESLELDPKIVQYIGIIIQDAIGITNQEQWDKILNVQSFLHDEVVRQSKRLQSSTIALSLSPKPNQQERSTVSISPRSSIVQIDS